MLLIITFLAFESDTHNLNRTHLGARTGTNIHVKRLRKYTTTRQHLNLLCIPILTGVMYREKTWGTGHLEDRTSQE